MKIIYRPKGAALEYATLACNLYQGTCPHGCRYCYAEALNKRTGRSGPFLPKIDALTRLDDDCRDLVKRGCRERVHLSFMGDCYAPEANITRQALEILRAHDVRFQVLTKGGERAVRDFDLYQPGPEGDWFGTTQVMRGEAHRQYAEPRAAHIDSREAAAREARSRGIYTWCSLEPVLDVGQALRVLEHTTDCYDEYRVGKLNHVALGWTVDWAAVALGMVEALQQTGRKWMLKDNLAALLPEGVPARSEAQ